MYIAIKFLGTGKIKVVLKNSIEYRNHSLGTAKFYRNRKIMVLGTKNELQKEIKEIESMRKELNEPDYFSVKFKQIKRAIKLF